VISDEELEEIIQAEVGAFVRAEFDKNKFFKSVKAKALQYVKDQANK